MNLNSIDFQQGRVKHILFKSKIRSILFGGKMDETLLSSRTSPSGQWLYNIAIPRYGSSMEMREVERLHREIHAYASSLVSLYKRGRIEEAREGLATVEAYSEKYLAAIKALEDKASRTY